MTLPFQREFKQIQTQTPAEAGVAGNIVVHDVCDASHEACIADGSFDGHEAGCSEERQYPEYYRRDAGINSPSG